MSITRRDISLYIVPHNGMRVFTALIDGCFRTFRTDERGESAWRSATRYFNQHANQNHRHH